MKRRQSDLHETCYFLLKLMFVWPTKLIIFIIRSLIRYVEDRKYRIDLTEYPKEDEWIDDEDNEQEIRDELNKYQDLPEMPEMCQIFNLDHDNCIGVEYVSMCPDETAYIRIIGDTTFSQLYKRRVYKEGTRRYFKLNNEKYYLDNRCTQPIGPAQAKKGK